MVRGLWSGVAVLFLAAPAFAQTGEAPDPPFHPSLELSGYLQVHYRGHIETNGDGETTPDDFRVQRARLGIEGEVLRHVGYDLEVDPRAPEITGVLRDAFVSLTFIPHHRVQLGQQKTVFGWENGESSTRLWAVNRTEVSDNLARGRTLRDIGIGVFGKWALSGCLQLEYAFDVVNGAGMNVQEDLTHRKNFWGRIGGRYHLRKIVKIWFGLSGGIGDQFDEGDDPVDPVDDFTTRFRRFGFDLEVDQKWFFLAAEWAMGREETGEDTERPSGFYVLLIGKTPWDVGPIFRYDELEDYTRWMFGAYYGEPDALLRVLVNYELREEEDVTHDHRVYAWVQVRFAEELLGPAAD